MPDDTTTGDTTTDDTTFALFEGDEGRLDEPQRRAFVALLRNRYIGARTHAAEWRTLLQSEQLLRSRLADLFLELHVDRDREVALKRQARSEGARRPFPTLLVDTAYTREETIVLVYLRMRLRADTRPGPDQVVVDRSEILGHVAGFRPPTATDRTRDEGRVDRAVERLVTARVLLKTSDPERFRIATVLEVLLPLERLRDLDTWLRHATDAPDAETDTDEQDVAARDTGATDDRPDLRAGAAPALPGDPSDDDDHREATA